ncbi:D-threo-aldose 1-dehydrogenase [Kribbella orskensis]|uniref:D-threo-aldose 1-dehydrogenase n=1 Tax=Kribbella orskensis TaxID=2512216 RepID=A0ABY2B6C3_9ACTN|nr:MULTISPECIES: aldo/keto reductase [Kribbella]TCN34378.1 D-threo-aldose 1-dehydrogenase [Kribbella sp. VKM Ac-2500]TCO07819.1 D-threo-aldose 1-dehydrogenase [Kribbella orskensis]
MTAPSQLLSPRIMTRFRPPRFGLDGSPIGELPGPDGDAIATATIDAAYQAGIRFFVTSPLYGRGQSERRFGTALARRPRGEFLVSTKVGRLADGSVDFSADGIKRSLVESSDRLELDVDLVFLDDPGEHTQQALDEAYPVLRELREQGAITAIGAAMDDWRLLDRFVRDTDLNAVLLAGQYSLLDRSAAPLLDRCQARGVAAIVSGVLTPQVLQTDRPEHATDAATILARRISAVCERYGVSLPQAALAFPGRHPAVTSVLIGAASQAEIRADAALVRQSVPAALWNDEELLRLLD